MRYVLERIATGFRLRTSSVATLPRLRNDFSALSFLLEKATSAAFVFFVESLVAPVIFDSERRVSFARAVFGSFMAKESTKSISPSANFRERAIKSAFARIFLGIPRA